MLLLPNGQTYVAPEWEDLAGKIVNGDGLGWAGDPRLSLRIGVLGNGARSGRRLEVWRYNEDGSETRIAHWRPEESFRICFDLAAMRVEAPGHVSVSDRIDQANEAHEAKNSALAIDNMSQALDHALRLHHDLNNPRNRFYMGGRCGARG